MDWIAIGLYVSYVLSGLCVAGALILPLISAASNPQVLIKTFVSFGAVALIFLVSYLISGSEVTATYTKFDVDAAMSKFIGGGMITVWLLIGLAFVGVISLEVNKMLNR